MLYVSGDVTLGDVQLVLPFSNTMDVLDLQGKYLREALEISVSEYNPDDPHGRFLQMSGKFLRLYSHFMTICFECVRILLKP